MFFISWITPYWYDDTTHSLVVYALYEINILAFPIDYPELKTWNMYSTMITIGPALHYPAVIFCKLFEWNFFNLRILMVCLNAFFSILIYKFSQNYFNPKSYKFSIILLLLNVQFLVYGGQYIGEIFMLQCVLWGLYFQFQAIFQQKTFLLASSQLFFWGAILTKEYIALPLGLYLLFAWIYYARKTKKIFHFLFFQGLTLPLASIIFYIFHFHDFSSFINYWHLKSDYQQEFLSFDNNSIIFILKKPLILLGFIALIIKILIKKKTPDIFMGILQTLLFIFFIMTKGYDRMGIVLLPIALFYASEWIAFLWHFICKTFFKRLVMVILLLLLGGQNTMNPLYWYNQWKKNQELKTISQKINQSGITHFFTYELEIIPYLKNTSIKTTPVPPISSYRIQQPLKERYFLVSQYAFTEYQHTFQKMNYKKLWKYQNYEMWKFKE